MRKIAQAHKWVLLAVVVAAGGVWVAFSSAAERTSREYEVAVGPYKSDTARMIEAYERLSSQYLTLVQQNLSHMAAADREILDKLTAIDKKLDEMSARLARLESPHADSGPSGAIKEPK